MQATQEDLIEVILRSGITDPRLIDAFRSVPRADFVPPEMAAVAYEDRPLPIPHDQVTTQPSLSAKMIEALELTPSTRVLEVGTGYGFQTALLAKTAEWVTGIERWPDLAEMTRIHLDRHDITNVDILVGDGSLGAPEAAPFDAILVSAAFTDVPPPLISQLAEGGGLVQPIGPGGNEMVTLFRKSEGELHLVRRVVPAYFVRLIGTEAFRDGDFTV